MVARWTLHLLRHEIGSDIDGLAIDARAFEWRCRRACRCGLLKAVEAGTVDALRSACDEVVHPRRRAPYARDFRTVRSPTTNFKTGVLPNAHLMFAAPFMGTRLWNRIAPSRRLNTAVV